MRRVGVTARATIMAVISTAMACGFGVNLDGIFETKAQGPIGDAAPQADADAALPAPDGSIPKVAVAQLVIGDDFACGRRTDGTVMCWGFGDRGALGNGAFRSSSVPVLVTNVSDAVDLAAGDDHACVVHATGAVSCWGENELRQLGDGTSDDSALPRPVVQLTDVVQVTGGGNFTCALLKDTTVHCWGDNPSGQLGDGTTTPRSLPAPVNGLTEVTQIAAAFATACALVKSGEVFCWGDNDYGVLGTGAPPAQDSPVPAKVSGLTGVTALSASGSGRHFCALLSSGEARCWGAGGAGRLGNADTDDQGTPVPVVAVADAASIASGSDFTCALRKDGTVSCWGANSWHQLGLGDTGVPPSTSSPVPTKVPTGAKLLAAGNQLACAVYGTGEQISCWGNNRHGALGRNSRLTIELPLALPVPAAATVALGHDHTCIVRAQDGAVLCWGSNEYRQLGLPYVSAATPTQLPSLAGVTKLAASPYLHQCAVMADGEVRCWGSASYGEHGNGSTATSRSTPVVFDAGGPATDVGGGDYFTCALLASKQVACAGNNSDTRLGRTGASSASPSLVTEPGDGGLVPFEPADKVAIGRTHSCAIRDARLWCWGNNADGRLGISGGDQASPVEVALPLAPTDVAAGGAHTCALLTDGSVRCWGANGDGQASGSGSGSSLRTPPLAGPAKSIVTGDDHSCALLTDGRIACWGRGTHGQLGNGVLAGSPTPVIVAGLSGAQAVFAGEGRTCALDGNQALHCWGENQLGQIEGTVLSGEALAVFGY